MEPVVVVTCSQNVNIQEPLLMNNFCAELKFFCDQHVNPDERTHLDVNFRIINEQSDIIQVEFIPNAAIGNPQDAASALQSRLSNVVSNLRGWQKRYHVDVAIKCADGITWECKDQSPER
jgi:hypothetical protein